MYELEIVNPVSPQQGEVSAFAYALRPSNLEGKVIGLMWNGKAHGDDALKRAGELIKERVPSVDVRFYSGALPFPDPHPQQGDIGDRRSHRLYRGLRVLHVVACLRHG